MKTVAYFTMKSNALTTKDFNVLHLLFDKKVSHCIAFLSIISLCFVSDSDPELKEGIQMCPSEHSSATRNKPKYSEEFILVNSFKGNISE